MSEIIKEAKNWGDSNGKRWEDYDEIVCPDGSVIDMKKLLEEQERAKAALNHLAPMLGGFLGKLRFIYTFRVSTQATDGFNILVNPQFTANMNFTEKCFVMAHEVMHCLLNHLRRIKGRDPNRSNIAADYEVNVTLCNIEANGSKRMLFDRKVVDGIRGYYDDKFKDMGFETIYDMIGTDSGNNMSNQQQSGQAGKNSDQSKQNQPTQGQSGSSGGSSGGSGGKKNSTPKSDAYKAGWKKAIEDYRAGKLKI